MRTSTRISRMGWIVAAVVVLLGLNGCGSSSSASGDASHSGTKKASSRRVTDSSNRPPDDMVAAVSAGKGGPPVGLRFEVRATPQAGQPVDVDLAILPDAVAIDHLEGKILSGDSVAVVEGGDIPPVDKPAQGSVIRHVVRLLPKQDGIFTVSAVVTWILAMIPSRALLRFP